MLYAEVSIREPQAARLPGVARQRDPHHPSLALQDSRLLTGGWGWAELHWQHLHPYLRSIPTRPGFSDCRVTRADAGVQDSGFDIGHYKVGKARVKASVGRGMTRREATDFHNST